MAAGCPGAALGLCVGLVNGGRVAATGGVPEPSGHSGSAGRPAADPPPELRATVILRPVESQGALLLPLSFSVVLFLLPAGPTAACLLPLCCQTRSPPPPAVPTVPCMGTLSMAPLYPTFYRPRRPSFTAMAQ